MALYKDVKQDNGITLSYHRILYLTITTNRQNSIVICSYVDGAARLAEKTGGLTQPYTNCITYQTDYSPSMTVELAYEYLKTLPEFAGATDI